MEPEEGIKRQPVETWPAEGTQVKLMSWLAAGKETQHTVREKAGVQPENASCQLLLYSAHLISQTLNTWIYVQNIMYVVAQ